MTSRPLPNAEALTSKWLRTDREVLASSLSDRTYTELPANHSVWPACRVTRIGGAPDGVDALFDEPLIQFDVWGGPKADAERVAHLIVARLASGLPFRTGDGCIKAVLRQGTMRYLPDATFDPARPRYIFDAVLLTAP